ncbi:SCO2525 family SAM-dependent methyltransferase [Cryptosporangium phraense]|uniref:Methyltransferase n=1 Tax=Cryptosporangium phraense TaxID=2593070 RepID=A0A545AW43_9ACTN|nr:SCO2525 family SAM-dependent methyltransferase [Cryptosporangium phraense]TQS45544.1 methyltransferase [Cryptosporangium phraense]
MVNWTRRNCDVNWDEFDAGRYLDHNYRTLRGDDHRFIEAMRDFFADFELPPSAIGVDLGSGTNLYPALAMLPFVQRVTLLDRGSQNVRYLEEQVASYDPSWDPFWKVLLGNPRYAVVTDPRAALRKTADVVQGDIFSFRPHDRYDMGTMFFVAESISNSAAEFETAVARFLGALKPGAPFAAAFMENSKGYDVGDTHFPAVRIGQEDVRQVLSVAAEGLTVHYEPAGSSGDALRAGYDGMILAVGRAKPELSMSSEAWSCALDYSDPSSVRPISKRSPSLPK